MLLAPIGCHATPTIAAGLLGVVFCAGYARDAVVRTSRRMRAAGGLGARLALLVTMPLQLLIRICALAAVLAAGYGLLLSITVALVGGPRAWALPAGLIAVAAGSARAWLDQRTPLVGRVLLPVIMLALLAGTFVLVPEPFWWPLA